MFVYIGIDWSEQKHDVLWMNPAGAALAHLVIAHTRPVSLVSTNSVANWVLRQPTA